MAQVPSKESELDDPSVYLEENWDESRGPFGSGLTWDEAAQAHEWADGAWGREGEAGA